MKAFHKFLIVIGTVAMAVFAILGISNPYFDNPEEPNRIPPYAEVVPKGFSAPQLERILDPIDAGRLAQPRLPIVRLTDAVIVEACPEGHPKCRAKAIYSWVKSNIEFVGVLPTRDHVISPEETILLRQGTDVDKSILFTAMLRAEGFPARVAITPYTTFVETTVDQEVLRIDVGCGICSYNTIRYEGPEEKIKWMK